ncbi:biotin transporter BioY [Intestinibacter sp.]
MKLTTREIILCGLFAALISILAQISIPLPFTTVPLTLQVFGIAITGLILGYKCGFIATLIYLILGGIGIPVFAQFSGGIGVLFGPTGGFLLGYPLMAFIIGYVREKFQSQILTAISMVVGLAIIYTSGTIMFSFVTGNTIIQSLLYCVVPFVAVDLLKLVLATVIGETVNKRIFSSLNLAK